MSRSPTKHFRHDTTFLLTRGDEEFELYVEYDIDPYDPGVTSGPPENCYPPEGGGVSDMRITVDGKPFEVTDEDDQRITRHVEETHDHGGYADYCDYDDRD